jgi:hypothetical protein
MEPSAAPVLLQPAPDRPGIRHAHQGQLPATDRLVYISNEAYPLPRMDAPTWSWQEHGSIRWESSPTTWPAPSPRATST